jgi:hypothetical protein
MLTLYDSLETISHRYPSINGKIYSLCREEKVFQGISNLPLAKEAIEHRAVLAVAWCGACLATGIGVITISTIQQTPVSIELGVISGLILTWSLLQMGLNLIERQNLLEILAKAVASILSEQDEKNQIEKETALDKTTRQSIDELDLFLDIQVKMILAFARGNFSEVTDIFFKYQKALHKKTANLSTNLSGLGSLNRLMDTVRYLEVSQFDQVIDLLSDFKDYRKKHANFSYKKLFEIELLDDISLIERYNSMNVKNQAICTNKITCLKNNFFASRKELIEALNHLSFQDLPNDIKRLIKALRSQSNRDYDLIARNLADARRAIKHCAHTNLVIQQKYAMLSN